MKKISSIILVFVLALSFVACSDSGDKESKGTTNGVSNKEITKVKGETYDTGVITALVPEGWLGVHEIDNMNSVQIGKEWTKDMDFMNKPYVQIDYYPDNDMPEYDKSGFENGADITPFTTGEYKWSGISYKSGIFTGAQLYTEKDDIQISVTVVYEINGIKISLEDPEVLAILKSIKINKK